MNQEPRDAAAPELARERSAAVEQRLRESERLYRQLAENVTDVIWTIDTSTWRYTYISPSIFKLRGLTVEEALVEPLDQGLTPESLALVMRRMSLVGQPGGLGPPAGAPQLTDVYDQPCRDGSVKHVEISMTAVLDEAGRMTSILGVSRDVTARIEAEATQQRTLEELRKALAEVNRLSGLIPICAYCKSIRDDAGYWDKVERYLAERAGAQFTHCICPRCLEKHFPEQG